MIVYWLSEWVRVYAWTKKSSSNADEKADTANHQATTKTHGTKKIGSLSHTEYISVSSSPPSFPSHAHTFVHCRLFIHLFICAFSFLFSRTFLSLRHDEYNKVSICGNLRGVEKRMSLGIVNWSDTMSKWSGFGVGNGSGSDEKSTSQMYLILLIC